MIMMMSTWNDWVLALLRMFLRITTRKKWRIVAGVWIMRQTRSFTFIKSIVIGFVQRQRMVSCQEKLIQSLETWRVHSRTVGTSSGDVTVAGPGVEISPFVYVSTARVIFPVQLSEAVLDRPQRNSAHVTTMKCAKFRWNRPNTFTTKTTQNVIVEICLNSIIGAGPGNQFDLSVAGCQLWTVTPLENGSDPLVCLIRIVWISSIVLHFESKVDRKTYFIVKILTSLVLSCGFCRTTGGC